MAKIYQFVARAETQGARRSGDHQVVAFKLGDRSKASTLAAPIMDVGGAWYHAEAVRVAEGFRER